MALNNKQRKTLEAIFQRPTRASIVWADIEKLLKALGGQISEGKGSAITVILNDGVLYIHRPHPQKEAKKYQVDDTRAFLEMLGIRP